MPRRSPHLWSVVTTLATVVISLSAISLCNARPVAFALRCPAYLIPGHRIDLTYRLPAKAPTRVSGKLDVFRLQIDGRPSQQALVSMPVQLERGSKKPITLDCSALPAVTADYLVRITAGKVQEYAAERRSQVKAWDLIGCFVDSLTEAEKRAIDKEMNEVPEGYNPDSDPYFDDEAEPEPMSYCSGMDPTTITSKQIAVKAWDWDQSELQGRRLYITGGVQSSNISAQDWQTVWDMKAAKKPWYDERGTVLYSLNGVFFTHNPGQTTTVKMQVSENGALDNAGNIFGEDYKTGKRDGTTVEKITIDGKGNVSGNQFWAVPHRDPSAYKASSLPPQPPKLTRFERFYPIYRDHIAEIVARAEKQEAESYREELNARQEAAKELAANEKSVLTDLEAAAERRQSKRLSFEGEAPVGMACIYSSDASARIIAELVKQNYISPVDPLRIVGYHAELLSTGWVSLARDILGKAEPHSSAWKIASDVLYRAGLDDEYRAELEQDAMAGNAPALYKIFFIRGKDSGLPLARKSAANDALLDKLCGKESRSDIRAVCAAYAAATGRIELAETIGSEVCALKYTGPDPKSKGQKTEPSGSEAWDDELFAARYGIGCYPGLLTTLFNYVRTEKAFRIILERSDAYRAMEYQTGKAPSEWKKLRDYMPAETELQICDGMIGSLKESEKRLNKKLP